MGIISRHSGAPYQDGQVLSAADLEADFGAIFDEFNGHITTPNIADGAVTTPKLGSLSLAQGSLADGAASGSEAQSATSTTVLTTSYQTIGSAVTHPVGNPARHVILMFSALVNANALNGTITFNVLKDGSTMALTAEEVIDFTTNHQKFHVTRTWVDTTPTAGTSHVYTIQAKTGSATTPPSILNPVIVAFEPRR